MLEHQPVATLQEGTSSIVQTYSAQGIARSLDMSVNVVYKILQNILHYYPFKIAYVVEMFNSDLSLRHTFFRISCLHERRQ